MSDGDPHIARGDSTLAVHASVAPIAPRGVTTPIFQSATFDLDADAYADIAATHGAGTWWYTRLGNPTVAAAAAGIAALERTETALLFASGMAAISTTLLALVPPGGRVVAARDLYGDTYTVLAELRSTGCDVRFVPIDDLAGFAEALADGADVVYVETLSNPMLRVADLDAIARLAHDAGAQLVVDATFTTPLNVRPAEHGADVILHSATKYLNGHSDVIAGAAAGSTAALEPIAHRAAPLGGCLDPHAAFLLARGLKTLALRMERHNANELAVARALEGRDDVELVAYPLLESHPDHALAQRLLRGGSGLVTVRVAGGDERAGRLLDELRVIRQAASLGGVESLASAPHNTSHLGLSEDERRRAGILPGTVRLSLGIEDAADLIDDLERALARSVRRAAVHT